MVTIGARMSPDRSTDPPIPTQEEIPDQNTRKRWAFAVATFFGCGYLKPGPGTWGSIAALLLWAAFAGLAHPSPRALLFALLAAIVVAISVGVPAASVVERESRRTDPGYVVIDEVIGQWITLLFCPANWPHALIALVLFRVFDITKPFPIRRLERLPAGWGIVFDDVAAGLYALVVAALVRIWF
jgi:phosphatidylglycerophosphatase A